MHNLIAELTSVFAGDLRKRYPCSWLTCPLAIGCKLTVGIMASVPGTHYSFKSILQNPLFSSLSQKQKLWLLGEKPFCPVFEKIWHCQVPWTLWKFAAASLCHKTGVKQGLPACVCDHYVVLSSHVAFQNENKSTTWPSTCKAIKLLSGMFIALGPVISF